MSTLLDCRLSLCSFETHILHCCANCVRQHLLIFNKHAGKFTAASLLVILQLSNRPSTCSSTEAWRSRRAMRDRPPVHSSDHSTQPRRRSARQCSTWDKTSGINVSITLRTFPVISPRRPGETW